MSEGTPYNKTIHGLHMWYGHNVRSVGALAGQKPGSKGYASHRSHIIESLDHLAEALDERMKDASAEDEKRIKHDLGILLEHSKQLKASVEVFAPAKATSSANSAPASSSQAPAPSTGGSAKKRKPKPKAKC